MTEVLPSVPELPATRAVSGGAIVRSTHAEEAAETKGPEESFIKVCVRVRPLNAAEEDAGGSIWTLNGNQMSTVLDAAGSTASYDFEKVYGPTATQKDVYMYVRPIIQSALEGFNGVIFAYGQTSAGKTHTMQGDRSNPGVIPRALHDIFGYAKASAAGGGRQFTVSISYVELYNEELLDLFNPNFDDVGRNTLQVRESQEHGVYVEGCVEQAVADYGEAVHLLSKGMERRHVAATQLNRESSRSHTILRFVLRSADPAKKSNARVATLALVDLAGSERSKRLQGRARFTEGCYINKSLLTLGIVIRKLAEGASALHIPYRDSRLTRLLQPALGGNAKAAVVCCATPAAEYAEHTTATLKFAQRCSLISNQVVVNESRGPPEELIRRYEEDILELRAQLQAALQRAAGPSAHARRAGSAPPARPAGSARPAARAQGRAGPAGAVRAGGCAAGRRRPGGRSRRLRGQGGGNLGVQVRVHRGRDEGAGGGRCQGARRRAAARARAAAWRGGPRQRGGGGADAGVLAAACPAPCRAPGPRGSRRAPARGRGGGPRPAGCGARPRGGAGG